jgi:serine/threonine protein kinase
MVARQVMDYTEGAPIDEYCNRRGYSITQRLQLFRTVCDAVHYAHQNLIVHRDIEPSSFLVTPDGVPGRGRYNAALGLRRTLARIRRPHLSVIATMRLLVTTQFEDLHDPAMARRHADLTSSAGTAHRAGERRDADRLEHGTVFR